MSTIFKMLGSHSAIDEEVNRIVDLEKEFKNVQYGLFYLQSKYNRLSSVFSFTPALRWPNEVRSHFIFSA